MKNTAVDTTQFRKPAGLSSAALTLLLAIPAVANAQQYTFTTIDVPSATRTADNANSTTAVAGEFDDADGNTHGFILHKDIFTAIDVPGASSTALNGINASGSFTGTYFDAGAGRNFAFVWRNGVFTTLDPAGSIHSQGGFINAQG